MTCELNPVGIAADRAWRRHTARMRARRLMANIFSCLCMVVLPTLAMASDDVQLRVQAEDGDYLAWADNRLSGPVEVRLQSDNHDVLGQPQLPARATVPAHGSVLVARLHRSGKTSSGLPALHLDTVPGSVNAVARDYQYLFPLQSREPRVEQGWGGRFSHGDAENHHAIDFAADTGTLVIAARDGIVMQIQPGADDHALARVPAHAVDRAPVSGQETGDANFIRILHDDGSMAVYAHLQAAGVLVQQGQRVRRGQPIGVSGSSGFSSGPHLHFAVQVNRGMRLESVPFQMFSPYGILRFSETPEATPTSPQLFP